MILTKEEVFLVIYIQNSLKPAQLLQTLELNFFSELYSSLIVFVK